MIKLKKSKWYTISGSLRRMYGHPIIDMGVPANNICKLLTDFIKWGAGLTAIYTIVFWFAIVAPIMVGCMWYDLGFRDMMVFLHMYRFDPQYFPYILWIVCVSITVAVCSIVFGVCAIVWAFDRSHPILNTFTNTFTNTTENILNSSTWKLLSCMWQGIKDKTCFLIEFDK